MLHIYAFLFADMLHHCTEYFFYTVCQFLIVPSDDKYTHGFDGQKKRSYILKSLGNTQSIPCSLFVV